MPQTKTLPNLCYLRGEAGTHERWHRKRQKFSKNCRLCRAAGRDAVENRRSLAQLQEELNQLNEVFAYA
jgi:nitrate/TMAO reductase-like tetraheme cytochrome c subunit